jgi:hypothetical protein
MDERADTAENGIARQESGLSSQFGSGGGSESAPD